MVGTPSIRSTPLRLDDVEHPTRIEQLGEDHPAAELGEPRVVMPQPAVVKQRHVVEHRVAGRIPTRAP